MGTLPGNHVDTQGRRPPITGEPPHQGGWKTGPQASGSQTRQRHQSAAARSIGSFISRPYGSSWTPTCGWLCDSQRKRSAWRIRTETRPGFCGTQTTEETATTAAWTRHKNGRCASRAQPHGGGVSPTVRQILVGGGKPGAGATAADAGIRIVAAGQRRKQTRPCNSNIRQQ